MQICIHTHTHTHIASKAADFSFLSLFRRTQAHDSGLSVCLHALHSIGQCLLPQAGGRTNEGMGWTGKQAAQYEALRNLTRHDAQSATYKPWDGRVVSPFERTHPPLNSLQMNAPRTHECTNPPPNTHAYRENTMVTNSLSA